MRFGLILVSAALLLSGCSTVRGIFGAAEETIEANQTEQEAGPPDAEASEPGVFGRQQAQRAAPITVAEDIKKAAKRLPDTLAGDSANSAHLGDPIPPQ
ncbi:hypothetical protein [Pedomonas mirosovicensis]|uniref:hypothetical protein n=1 Tax=Pedomonas mirosovicensis TaxID=2908641 RepID=UPI00216A77E3|nr:hypothetical protein [Pedomonas mirosovicensis]MCH8684660.1 hypothetical protein [Pedomonas mirosovicensis]